MVSRETAWALVSGAAGLAVGLGVGAALARGTGRPVQAYTIHSTESFLHPDGTVQQVWDRVPAPRQIYSGQSTYETLSTARVGSLEPLQGALWVRVQLVGVPGAPNYNYRTKCRGAVMQGNGQRFVDFTVENGQVPVKHGALTQFTLEYQAFPDELTVPLGARLVVA